MKMTASGNAWSYLEDTVFQINDQIQRFRRGDGYNLEWESGKENEKRIAYLVPAMFDKENRSFNWVVVADPLLKVAASDGNLNDEDTKYVAQAEETIFGGLYEKLRKGKKDDEKEAAWERFKNRYGSETDFAARMDLIRRNVDACAQCNPSSGIHPSVGIVEEAWTELAPIV